MISKNPYGHPLDFTSAPPDPFYPENVTRQSAFGTFLEQSDWMEKSQDEDYTKAWLVEAGLDDDIEASMFHEMFSHYRDGVQKLREHNIPIVDPDMHGRWMRDDSWHADRKIKISAVEVLENIPAKERGFPCDILRLSTGTTDPLDPSMYPIVYTKTLTLKNGEFESISLPLGHVDEGLDDLYCWLPTEFEVAATSGSTKIFSYINNLSLPGHDSLFHPTFEKLFTDFIPLFNYTLADPGYRDRSWDWNRYSAPQWGSCGYDLQNEVGWRDPKTLAQRRLEGTTVKAITRLLKISLLPEDAHYIGDEWHVDGYVTKTTTIRCRTMMKLDLRG
ncbi:hypothetical protein TWF706_009212 [Orbilia oligospora]|nr:hypothetical protein TWF706_009212 [Orbilia oligospora]